MQIFFADSVKQMKLGGVSFVLRRNNGVNNIDENLVMVELKQKKCWTI